MSTDKPTAPTPEVPLGQQLFNSRYAEAMITHKLEEMWGEDAILGISWDDYDGSLEVYVCEGTDTLPMTTEHVDVIKAMGFERFWVNYPDGTETYNDGPRKAYPEGHNNWQTYSNSGWAKRHKAPAPEVTAPTIGSIIEREVNTACDSLYPAPVSVEQQIRDALERMEVEGAQNFSAGELVELANLVCGRAPAPEVCHWTRDGDSRRGLTSFTYSRFLVPYLCEYKGTAVFMDEAMQNTSAKEVQLAEIMRLHRDGLNEAQMYGPEACAQLTASLESAIRGALGLSVVPAPEVTADVEAMCRHVLHDHLEDHDREAIVAMLRALASPKEVKTP